MTFEPTALAGVVVVHLDPIHDERGFFAHTFDADVFRAEGLVTAWTKSHLSNNRLAGTLRGLHLQHPPAAETKLVRCVRGAIYDVVADARPGSPTYGQWVARELSAANRDALYIPEGYAHGFQALEDDSDVFYEIAGPYTPSLADGYRYDDPVFGIDWPLPVSVISARDRVWPLLAERTEPRA